MRLYEGANLSTNPSHAIERSDLGWLQFHFALAPVPEVAARYQLKFMIKPDSRRDYEDYITQQATATGYKGLVPSNWQEIPDFTVANLHHYFQDKNKR